MGIVMSSEDLIWTFCFIVGSCQAYFELSIDVAKKVRASREGHFLRKCNDSEVTAAEMTPGEDQSYSALLSDWAKSVP